MAKTTQYSAQYQPDSRSQVFPYDDATINVFIGNDDGDSFIIGGLDDNDNAIAAWWRSKRIDCGDQQPEYVDWFKTLEKVQLEYVDQYADTPITIAISDDGGEHWVYKTRLLGTGDGRQKVADFYFHDKDRITSKDFTVKLLSADNDTTFTWTGIYLYVEPRGPFMEI